MKKSKPERKGRHEVFEPGPGFYAEKLTVISIQYLKK